jgi:hypothetical protein
MRPVEMIEKVRLANPKSKNQQVNRPGWLQERCRIRRQVLENGKLNGEEIFYDKKTG